MSTEPTLNTKNFLSGLYGASASSIIWLMLIVFVVIQSSGNEDGSVGYGLMFAYLFSVLPIGWVLLFIYFLFISCKKVNRLRFAIIFQTIWITLLSGFISWLIFDKNNLVETFIVFGALFLSLSIIVGIGSWFSTLTK
ncbi:MAG: hypothetical protein HRU38_02105 [Saccharospirillaceae bacterium]|nr:hypothetical protein [Pseudomonadales bacterium]NRB77453.1 hypothetical protein [Saccharospirillaceae bacterium]